MEIHTELGGSGAGRRHRLEVLNKSAVVLLVACWERYVEDLAQIAFDYMLERSDEPTMFPAAVLTRASASLRDAQDGRRIWALAGAGWRQVLKDHRDDICKRHIGKLNTPRPKQVDALFAALVGVPSLSAAWSWPGMSREGAVKKLDNLVTLRGEIAHRVETTKVVKRAGVEAHRDFLYRLAVKSSNSVRSHLKTRTGKVPWTSVRYGKTR
jgi:hypothetical protein